MSKDDKLITFNIGIDKDFKKEVTDYLDNVDGISLSELVVEGLNKEFDLLKKNRGSLKNKRQAGNVEPTNICLDSDLKHKITMYLKTIPSVTFSALASTGLKKEFALLKRNNGVLKSKVKRLLQKDFDNYEKAKDNLINVSIELAEINTKITASKFLALSKKAIRFNTALETIKAKLETVHAKSLEYPKRHTKLQNVEMELMTLSKSLMSANKETTVLEISEKLECAIELSDKYNKLK